MKKAKPKTWGGARKGSGRRASGADRIRTIRLSDALIAEVDLWASKELGAATARSEGIRQLLEAGLRAKRKRKPETRQSKIPVANRTFEFLQMAEQFFGGYMLIPDRHPLDFAKYFLFATRSKSRSRHT
jgi:hypothetical protein